ncbi:hypothetical protein [Streptomyces sp. B6B3]|uniref:hypothetical protein n=1 Tax=Streptomyces sp. B6B3 TaxID=3153570 RepID=UPI00325F0F26
MTAVTVALVVTLSACDGGGGRRSGGSSGGSDGGSGSSADKHDDDDLNLDDLGDAGSAGGTGTDEEPEDALPATEETANAILPDLPALEGTVFTVSGGRGDTGFCQQYTSACGSVAAQSQIGFLNAAEDEIAAFQLLAHDSAADAGVTLANAEDEVGADETFGAGGLAAAGDDGASYVITEGGEQVAYVTFVQRGPYVGIVTHSAEDPSVLRDTSVAESLNAMLDARMTQATAGQQPTATVG